MGLRPGAPTDGASPTGKEEERQSMSNDHHHPTDPLLLSVVIGLLVTEIGLAAVIIYLLLVAA